MARLLIKQYAIKIYGGGEGKILHILKSEIRRK
jgi:hypothetical protein